MEVTEHREKETQSAMGERDAKIRMLEAQLTLLAECQEHLGVTREKRGAWGETGHGGAPGRGRVSH